MSADDLQRILDRLQSQIDGLHELLLSSNTDTAAQTMLLMEAASSEAQAGIVALCAGLIAALVFHCYGWWLLRSAIADNEKESSQFGIGAFLTVITFMVFVILLILFLIWIPSMWLAASNPEAYVAAQLLANGS